MHFRRPDGSSFSGPGTFPLLGGRGADFDFDFEVYGIFPNVGTLFSPASSGQSAPTGPLTSRGQVPATTTGAASSLAPGTLIDGSSIFNPGSPAAAAPSIGAPVIFGFRFRNEGPGLNTAADDTVHFGRARVVLTAAVPGSLVDCAFEATPPAGIRAGVVPEPAACLLMAPGVAGLVARQRLRAPD